MKLGARQGAVAGQGQRSVAATAPRARDQQRQWQRQQRSAHVAATRGAGAAVPSAAADVGMRQPSYNSVQRCQLHPQQQQLWSAASAPRRRPTTLLVAAALGDGGAASSGGATNSSSSSSSNSAPRRSPAAAAAAAAPAAVTADSPALTTTQPATQPPAPAQPAPGDVEVEFLGVVGGMQTVRGVLHLDACPDLIYQILTDYDRCSEVFENISASATLDEGGEKQVVQVRQRREALGGEAKRGREKGRAGGRGGRKEEDTRHL